MSDIAHLGFRVNTTGILKAEQDLDRLDKAGGRVTRQGAYVGESMGKTSKSIGLVGGAAAGAAGNLRAMGGVIAGLGIGLLASRALEYADALAEVSTLVDKTTFDMGRLSDEALRLSGEFGASPISTVKAYYQAISAGAGTAIEATEAVTAANKLAVGGVTGVEIAIDGLTSVMNAYNGEAGTFTDISDSMFVAMRAGKTTIGQISSSIGKLAPIAARAGASFEELMAGVAALTKGGQSTSMAMNGVRAIMTSIIKPSKEAAALAEVIGLKFNAAGLEAMGFAGFMDHVREKTGGSAKKMAILFGGVEALTPALALTGKASEDFAATLDNMAKKSGETEDAFAKMAASPGFQMNRITESLTASFLAFSNVITTAAVPALTLIADNMHLFEVAVVAVAVVLAARLLVSLKSYVASKIAAVAVERAHTLAIIENKARNASAAISLVASERKRAGAIAQTAAQTAIRKKAVLAAAKAEVIASRGVLKHTTSLKAHMAAERAYQASLVRVRTAAAASAQATNAARSAKERSIAASAALTAATNTGSVAQRKASAAMRGAKIASMAASGAMLVLSGAMALLGGPLGIALLAAAGIYALVQRQSEYSDSADEAAQKTTELEEALRSKGGAALELARQELQAQKELLESYKTKSRVVKDGVVDTITFGFFNYDDEIETTKASIERLTKAIGETEASLEGAGDASDLTADSLGDTGDAAIDAAKEFRRLIAELDLEYVRLTKGEQAAREHELALKGLVDEAISVVIAKEKTNKALKENAEMQAEAAKSYDEFVQKIVEENILLAEGEEALFRHTKALEGWDDAAIDAALAAQRSTEALKENAEMQAEAAKSYDEFVQTIVEENILLTEGEEALFRHTKALEGWDDAAIDAALAAQRSTQALKDQDATAQSAREEIQKTIDRLREQLPLLYDQAKALELIREAEELIKDPTKEATEEFLAQADAFYENDKAAKEAAEALEEYDRAIADFWSGAAKAIRNSDDIKDALNNLADYAANWLVDLSQHFKDHPISVHLASSGWSEQDLEALEALTVGLGYALQTYQQTGDARVAAGSGIGAVVGSEWGPLGAAIGAEIGKGLFGSKKRISAVGYQLGVEAGTYVGQGFVEYSRDRAFWGGTSKWRIFKGLDAQISRDLNEFFTGLHDSIYTQFDALGVVGADTILDSFSMAVREIKTEEELQQWLEDTTLAAYQHAFSSLEPQIKDIALSAFGQIDIDEQQLVNGLIDFSRLDDALRDVGMDAALAKTFARALRDHNLSFPWLIRELEKLDVTLAEVLADMGLGEDVAQAIENSIDQATGEIDFATLEAELKKFGLTMGDVEGLFGAAGLTAEDLAERMHELAITASQVMPVMEQLGFALGDTFEDSIVAAQTFVDALGGVDAAMSLLNTAITHTMGETESLVFQVGLYNSAIADSYEALGLHANTARMSSEQVWALLQAEMAKADVDQEAVETLARLYQQTVAYEGAMATLDSNMDSAAATMRLFGVSIDTTTDAGRSAVSTWIDMAGGLDQFQQAAASVYDWLFTEEEKKNNQIADSVMQVKAFNDAIGEEALIRAGITDGYIDTADEARAYLESLEKGSDEYAKAIEMLGGVKDAMQILQDSGMSVEEALMSLPEDVRAIYAEAYGYTVDGAGNLVKIATEAFGLTAEQAQAMVPALLNAKKEFMRVGDLAGAFEVDRILLELGKLTDAGYSLEEAIMMLPEEMRAMALGLIGITGDAADEMIAAWDAGAKDLVETITKPIEEANIRAEDGYGNFGMKMDKTAGELTAGAEEIEKATGRASTAFKEGSEDIGTAAIQVENAFKSLDEKVSLSSVNLEQKGEIISFALVAVGNALTTGADSITNSSTRIIATLEAVWQTFSTGVEIIEISNQRLGEAFVAIHTQAGETAELVAVSVAAQAEHVEKGVLAQEGSIGRLNQAMNDSAILIDQKAGEISGSVSGLADSIHGSKASIESSTADATKALNGLADTIGQVAQAASKAAGVAGKSANDANGYAYKALSSAKDAADSAANAARYASNTLDKVSNLKLDVDGSHASGLARVPYDGYIGELHADEMVMPSNVSNWLRSAGVPVAPQDTRSDRRGSERDNESARELKAIRQELERLRDDTRTATQASQSTLGAIATGTAQQNDKLDEVNRSNERLARKVAKASAA